MRICQPKTLAECLQRLDESNGSAKPVAGGTDLLVNWHHHVKDDWTLLDLSNLKDELGQMRLTDDTLELGALTTYWDVIRSDQVSQAFPLLPQAAQQVGAIQIQTRGTWAGNIANGSPAADGVPVLMAYDARVVLQSATTKREVPLDTYFTGYKQSVRQPNELITAIGLPRKPRSVEWFEKVGQRRAQAIAKLGVAVVRDDTTWRIAANSVNPYVCRCPNLEAKLQANQTFTTPEELQKVLEQDITPIDDIRSTAAYRTKVLSRVLFYGLAEQPPTTP